MLALLKTPDSMHVEELGKGPPVLLLHSSGLSGRQWSRLAKALVERGFSVRVPDLTGHGSSSAWPEPRVLSFRDDVAQIGAFLARNRPAHVVGHSYGALVGLFAAELAPFQVRSLTLFEPVAFGCLDPVADADARSELAGPDFRWGPTAEDRERWLQTFVDFWGGPGAWASLREDVRTEFRRVGWAIYQGVSSLLKDETPASAHAWIQCRVQLLTGERSPLPARRVIQRLNEVLPDSKVFSFQGAGHMAPLTHVEQVNAVVIDGLEALDPIRRY